jgi:riboflavin kinase/FMN adenylyltransferase
VETHILDNEIDIVEGKVILEFVDFIRINHKFDSLDALKAQIQHDITKAKKRLA